MKTFICTDKQWYILEGIAYWTFEKSYIMERDADDKQALEQACKNILYGFDEADAADIPVWVVNSAIKHGADWRYYKATYFFDEMEKIGIYRCKS